MIGLPPTPAPSGCAFLRWHCSRPRRERRSRRHRRPPPPPAPPPTPAQAQQTLDILQDPKKLATLIGTLQTLAKTAPGAEPVASPAPPPPAPPAIQLAPDSLGAQLLPELTGLTGRIAAAAASTVAELSEAPLLWRVLMRAVTDPDRRVAAADAVLADRASVAVRRNGRVVDPAPAAAADKGSGGSGAGPRPSAQRRGVAAPGALCGNAAGADPDPGRRASPGSAILPPALSTAPGRRRWSRSRSSTPMRSAGRSYASARWSSRPGCLACGW